MRKKRKNAKNELKEYKENNPCLKKVLIDKKTGEISYSRCGRRTCPRCAAGYATERAKAIEFLHGKKATHMVLTVDRNWIGTFPTRRDYIVSKNFTRQVFRKRNENRNHGLAESTDIPLPDSEVLECRRSIAKGSRRSSRFIAKLKDKLQTIFRLGSIGTIRATEFGEHKTRRWHTHLVFMIDTPMILQALQDIGASIYWNPDRKIYTAKSVPGWKWGMIRIKPCNDAQGAIYYMMSYVDKGTPGRLIIDKKSSKLVSQYRTHRKKVYSNGHYYEFARAGGDHWKKQSVKDRRFEQKKKRIRSAK